MLHLDSFVRGDFILQITAIRVRALIGTSSIYFNICTGQDKTMFKKYIILLTLFVLSFFSLPGFTAGCSPADVISLSKSGYSRQEIDRLCCNAAGAGTRAAVGVRELSVTDIPRGASYKGRVVRAISWDDALGSNYLLLTVVDAYRVDRRKRNRCDDAGYCYSAELFGYHFVRNRLGLKRLWRIRDLIQDCSYDVTLEFLPASLEVTDLDRDGITESSFVYRLACRSDVSGAGMKLMMHEGKKKLALRGSTLTPYEPGEMKIDPAFNSSPAIFRTHAVDRWNQFNKEFFDTDQGRQ